ncbi:permease-like cell division protein FtsX [Patescibacteria group bacterium]|nr:permease-like cell division protein FtsX [Patescibacteria group bacterium]MBU4512983.1 permease-like cell division protein FtsX [Patescibacteria group bacterium]MCG2693020.1 permease-like cell division protein FtsX [Candidatus Parcubacteria bacterium]
MFISLFRLTKLTLQNFFRNIWLSIVTLTIVILALISINILITLNVLTNTAVETIKDKIDISLYFKPEVSGDQVYTVKAKIETFDKVANVDYISPDQALVEFRARHEDNPLLMASLDELDGNPLGATLVIKAKNLEDYASILAKIQGPEFGEYANFIQETNFNDYELVIGKLNKFSKKVQTVGIVVIGIFLLITILIIFNTIRIAIYTHQEEISIMRLVGATSWFIRGPFLMESALYGLFAWGITMTIIFPFLNFARPHLMIFLGTQASEGFDIVVYFQENFLSIFGFQLVLIVLLSMISSNIAIRRYLRV